MDRHLTDADLDVLVDERVNDPSWRAISSHTAACAMCRAEVEDLRRFDAEEFPLPGASRRWLIAAVVAFLAVGLAVIAIRWQRPVSTPAVPVAVSTAPASATQPAPAPRVVASLTDNGAQIALLDNGTIAGVETPTAQEAEEVKAALAGRLLAIPTFVAAMPGAVRGETARTHPIRAIEPFRSAVRESRPRFTWSKVRDARSYRVAVFDADYEEIARSDALTSPSWTPSRPLPTGVDLSWHVVAETDAGEISSAGSDRAEAVFRVLPANEAAEVRAGEARYAKSHLMRGLLYSRHGLLHDAERELRRLAEENPDSTSAKSLLASLSR